MSEHETTLPAVQHQVHVQLAPAAAFELFTRGIARWWPFRGHSCFGDEAADVVFEPRIGGAVTEVARDGARMAWGTLTEWSPPDGFAMRWFPGLDDSEATTLSVRFQKAGPPESPKQVPPAPSGFGFWCRCRLFRVRPE